MANAAGAAARPDDPPHLKIAFSKLGLKEIPGANDNPVIVGMFAAIGRPDIRDDETSWCACFVGWSLHESGVPLQDLPPKSQRLLARSYLDFGSKVATPERGDIVVFERGNSSWQGHVAFFLRFVTIDGVRYVEVIGGNQSNAVTIARYSASKVLGYRRAQRVPQPSAPPQPKTDKASAAGKAAAGVIVATGTGSVAAASAGVPWWAILVGAGLGLLGAVALIIFLNKRG